MDIKGLSIIIFILTKILRHLIYDIQRPFLTSNFQKFLTAFLSHFLLQFLKHRVPFSFSWQRQGKASRPITKP